MYRYAAIIILSAMVVALAWQDVATLLARRPQPAPVMRDPRPPSVYQPVPEALDATAYGDTAARQGRMWALTEGPVDVVVVGDSNVQGARVEEVLSRPGMAVANRGLSGARSDWMVPVLRDHAARLRPRVVVVHAGTNDVRHVAYSAAYTLAGLQAALLYARDDLGAMPVWSAIPPLGPGIKPNQICRARDGSVQTVESCNEQIAAINAAMRAWCDARLITVVDAGPDMADLPDGGTYDGIHMDADAVAAWRDQIWRAVERIDRVSAR